MKRLFDGLHLIAIDMDEVTRKSLDKLDSKIALEEKAKGQHYEYLYDAVENHDLKSLLSSLHAGLWSFCNYLRLYEREGKAQAYLGECGDSLARLVETSLELCESIRIDGLVIEIDDTWKELFTLLIDVEVFIGAIRSMPLDAFKCTPIFHVVRCAEVKEGGSLQSRNLKWIGAGAFADVFAFDDSLTSTGIALKIAKKGLSDGELKSFRREYQLMRMLESVNVLGVFDYADNADAYVMELMDSSLEDYVLSGYYPDLEDRIVLLRKLLAGIEDINEKGILHRDLSPGNILIKFSKDGPAVKLSDFGMAKSDEDNEDAWDGPIPGLYNDKVSLSIIGFENYGIEHETFAATLLSLFVLTRCQLIGHQGFNDKNDLKGPLRSTILKGLNENLSSRYQSITELSGALEMVYPLLLTQ